MMQNIVWAQFAIINSISSIIVLSYTTYDVYISMNSEIHKEITYLSPNNVSHRLGPICCS